MPVRVAAPPLAEPPQARRRCCGVHFAAESASLIVHEAASLEDVAGGAPQPVACRRRSGSSPPLLIARGAASSIPSALIVGQAFTGGDGHSRSPKSPGRARLDARSRTRFLHTIEIAVAASAGCLALGFVMALILAFVPFPGSRRSWRG